MDKPQDSPLPREVEEVLKELSAQNLIFGNRNLQLNDAFSKRLEEVSRSVLESPHLSPTLASELRAGFGQNLGAKLVDWVWDSLSPTFKQAPGPNPASDFVVETPEDLKANLQSVLKRLAQTYFRDTGVHLPPPEFIESQEVRVRFRSLTLGIASDPSDLPTLEEELLEALYWGSGRFLTPHQVKQRLHDLWTQRPELFQMYLEEGVGLTSVLDVLRYLLDRQYSIWDLDLIVEEVIFQYRLKAEESVAERVENSLSELLKESRFGPGLPEGEAQPKATTDLVRVEMGRDALFTREPQRADAFFERMRSLRRVFVQKAGWLPPAIRLVDNLTLPKEEYRIFIREREVASGQLWPDLLMVIGTEDMLDRLRGLRSTEPLRGQPCLWIPHEDQELASDIGCLSFTSESVMATLLTDLLERDAEHLFSLQNVQDALDDLKERNRTLAEIVEKDPEILLLIKDVCCELLAERVPLLDKEFLFESVLRERHSQLSPYYLAEKVRRGLSHLVYRDLLDLNQRLSAFTLTAELEAWCYEALVEDAVEARLDLDELEAQALRDALLELGRVQVEAGQSPILIAPNRLRKPLWKFCRALGPDFTVLAEDEVPFKAVNHLGEASLGSFPNARSIRAKHRLVPACNKRFRRPQKIRKHR